MVPDGEEHREEDAARERRSGSGKGIDTSGEQRDERNECMTPAYCARSNDIRDIIPAS